MTPHDNRPDVYDIFEIFSSLINVCPDINAHDLWMLAFDIFTTWGSGRASSGMELLEPLLRERA